MIRIDGNDKSLTDSASAMKRDWDERARENAKWYINTVRKDQTDDEFDATAEPEVEKFVLADPVLTQGRDISAEAYKKCRRTPGPARRFWKRTSGALRARTASDWSAFWVWELSIAGRYCTNRR